MRVLRVLTVTLFAFVTCIGAVLAADDPLEIHGGGRVGIQVTGQGGATASNFGPSNYTGYMPDYGQTRYWSLSFSKKYKSDDGSWAQVSTAIDKWNASTASDLVDQQFRFRDAHVEFGGLDFLPAGTVLWGGLRGYGQGGYNMEQDHGFIDLNGVGFGLDKIGGVASIAYMKQDSAKNAEWTTVAPAQKGLGVPTLHNFILGVNVPMLDIYAMFGYAPGAPAQDATDSGNDPVAKMDPKTGVITVTPAHTMTPGAPKAKDITQFYIGGVFHAPVAGLNVGAIYCTGSYAFQEIDDSSDPVLNSTDGAPGAQTQYSGDPKLNQYSDFALTAWSVTDIMPGLYVVPAIRADIFTIGKDTAGGKAVTNTAVGISVRLSKALTKNIAVVPVLGYYYTKSDATGAKAYQYYAQTLALEIALNHGFWSGPKLQFYVSEAEVNSDAKKDKQWLGAAYANKGAGTILGLLVTYGF
jgi:maltoporin